MHMSRAVRMLAVGAAAAGLFTATGGSAQAQDGYSDGDYQASTKAEFVNCGGEVQLGTSLSNGSLYARGGFTLNLSSRGRECWGWLERSTDGGHTWTTISGGHHGAGVFAQTYYYYDGVGYLARVCVGDLLYDNSYSCGAGV